VKHLPLAAALLFAPIPALALPSLTTNDTLNITGNATFTGTTVTFTNPAALDIGTGAFAAMGTCMSCANVSSPLTYNPFTAVVGLLSATNNGLTASVDITGVSLPPVQVGNTLDITDDGILHLTGYAATPGVLDLTVNQATGIISGSFSATAQPVGEPAGFAVLGMGLLGLCAVRWARS
jgi:hypothetical protein